MKLVELHEILNRSEYEKIRESFREKVLQHKAPRRVHLGENLTFLFETHDSILYQIQEMIRAENHQDPAAVRHELETYNELLGKKGELGCTLLIEIDSPEERAQKLQDWKELPKHIFMRTDSGAKIPAIFDPRQMGESRLSSVQYLKFILGDNLPKALGVEHPKLKLEVEFNPQQKLALTKDLIS